MARLNQMILNFRESKLQSIEAIAMMLQLSEEDYNRLEKEWIPPDDVLKRICSLFEWNYQEIKRISLQIPINLQEEDAVFSEEEPSVKPSLRSFHEQLKKGRIEVGQTPEGMAMLLGISEDYYLSLEETAIPEDAMLRRICSLFSLNYLEARQKLLSHHNPVFLQTRPPLSYEELLESVEQVETISVPEIPGPQLLSNRLREERENVSQTIEGIALLLKITPEFYEKIESGELVPDEELLKNIAVLFEWNYYELLEEDRRSRFNPFQNSISKIQSRTSKDSLRELNEVLGIIREGWSNLRMEQQKSLLNQMELIRDTMLHWQGKTGGEKEDPGKSK